MIDVVDTYFFELLQVAVGNRDSLSGVPTEEEWEEIYEVAKKQTLVGIAFKGVERLPQGQLPPKKRIRQWFMKADKIRKRNEKMNIDCAKTCYVLRKMGFHSCIIKGQANMRCLSPANWLSSIESPTSSTFPRREGERYGLGWYRTPGDIDVWAWSESGRVADVIRAIKGVNPRVETYYHHADCDLAGDTETEVHYRASWMCAPWRNRVLQRFCDEQKANVGRYPVFLPDGRKTFFYVPSVEFDAVYQLVHIYRHLFYEGIGLRQMLDYWAVLASLVGSEKSQAEAYRVICRLGMKRFAAAVMWVLREVFDPQHKEWMLCEPNEKYGRFLLKEIMLAGNFGHEDERINVTKDHWLRWGIMKLKRNMKFLTAYPEEVICEPLFRVYHWAWRTFKLYKF